MPIISESSYLKRPRLQFNAWIETLAPYYMSKPGSVLYKRERLELIDGDFIDLDWVKNDAKSLIVISHGFEGNSKDHFIEEVCKNFDDFDMLVWHYRSCSRSMNRLQRFYSHGDIEDLDAVIKHASKNGAYDQIILLGFSMGGNLVINYLGSEIRGKLVVKGIVFSTPMDLRAAARKMENGFAHLVEKSFMKKWRRKIELKAGLLRIELDAKKLRKTKSLEDLLSEFVLPHHGFSNIQDYYDQWSSAQFLSKITVPLLIVNAKNDPLLSEKCYPYELANYSDHVFLETPAYGGHIGFDKKINELPWYIYRIKQFLSSQ